MTQTAAASHVLDLHEIKGVLTKFMRMLFPLEFRLDGITGEGAVSAAFRYPLLAGEVIYLPERSDNFTSRDEAFSYYKVIAAHLAARHEFGSFAFKLGDQPGFEERGETGLEALHAFVASFPDPKLAGAMLRLCEAARIDAALAYRYRGLAPEIAAINRRLVMEMPPMAISTMLFKAASGMKPGAEPIEEAFVNRSGGYFAPLRDPAADINLSVRQTTGLYGWLIALIEAAQQGNSEALDENTQRMLNDLTQSLGNGDEDGLQGMEQDGDGDGEGGEPDQNVKMQVSGKRGKGRGGQGISPEELRRLLERGAQIRPSESDGEGDGGDGMYLTQLDDKQAQALMGLQEQLSEAASFGNHGRLVMSGRSQDSYYAYDEWDYSMNDYRRNWCRLREIVPEGDDGEFYARTLRQYAEMLPQIRRHFQRIRPASYRMVRGLEDGDDFDLDRAVEHRVARAMGNSPDPRVYKARKKEARDVATLFLLDMSASTDEPIHQDYRSFADADDPDDWLKVWQRRGGRQRPRRIIDVNKEALVIMAQALEEIGDAYAIMGFSGHGRDNVEFYVIKEFDRELSDEVKGRVGAVEPKRSTRMGTAIRHAREKFKDVSSRAKHVILLSDGFPQDFDYGHDRRSNAYGIQDTMVALKELEMAGVMPFCITVDRTGHDYLRQMCAPSRYLVIDDITSLPKQLPKIYEQIVRW